LEKLAQRKNLPERETEHLELQEFNNPSNTIMMQKNLK